MKIQAMLDWSSDEKAAKVKEWTQSLFTLRLQKATGQLENPMKIKQLRKDIARLKTAQHMGAAELAAAAAHEVTPATTEGAEETGTKTPSSGKSAATPKPKGHAAATPSGKGAKKRAAAAKATQKKTTGASAKAHSPSKKSSSSSSGASAKKAAPSKARSATPKKSKKK
jgi:large subunit ribosomal protein L29